MHDQKTVFISYRREPASFIVRAIFQYLIQHGYDVFYDMNSIDSGEFDRIIARQISARAHFVLVLTPGTLNRCADEYDWVRKEIEIAIDTERNIVPFVMENFEWDDLSNFLPEKFNVLRKHNAVPKVSIEYFDAALERLRTRHLKTPEYVALEAVVAQEQALVQAQIEQAKQEPPVTQAQLTAEEYMQLGSEAFHAQKYTEAEQHFRQAIQANPNNSNAYYNYAMTKHCLSEYLIAVTNYDEALRLNPRFINAYLNRGFTLMTMNKYERAIKDFDKAISLDGKNAKAHMLRGQALGLLKDKGALPSLAKALRLDPNLVEVYFYRAELLFETNPDAALQDLDRAIALKSDALSYFKRGTTYAKLGKLQEAVDDYAKSIELDTGFVEAYFHRAELLLESNPEVALEDFGKVIELKPDSRNYFKRGFAHAKLGKLQEAVDDYAKSIELEPNFAMAYNNRAWELQKMGPSYLPEALKDALTAVKLQPHSRSIRDTLGVVYRRMSRFSEAIEIFDSILAIDPTYEHTQAERERAIQGDTGMSE
jgi:tetratricopeptide (TPR) repeat protein